MAALVAAVLNCSRKESTNVPLGWENITSGAKPGPPTELGAPGVGCGKYASNCGLVRSRPKETSVCCGGKVGANSETTLVAGSTSARYSPFLSSLKLVCNRVPGLVRFFSEANTTR